MHIQEKSFNESVSLCLTIEKHWLFLQRGLDQGINADKALLLLTYVLRLMELLARSDTKIKLLQELSYFEERIQNLKFDESDDSHVKQALLKRDDVVKKLTHASRILAAPLLVDPFLRQFYYRQECLYDSPACETWCAQSEEEIKLQIHYWMHFLTAAWQSVEIILWSIRATGVYQDVTVQSGVYRHEGDSGVLNISLVRVSQPSHIIYPVLSVARRWLVLTLYEGRWSEGAYKHEQLAREHRIQLAVCS
jgi:cell division FtsZ-interacting protein ZapD